MHDIVIYMNNTDTIKFVPGYINMPKKFDGSNQERQANIMTHNFYGGRCMECDCRPSGRVAEWPCGQEPERVLERA